MLRDVVQERLNGGTSPDKGRYRNWVEICCLVHKYQENGCKMNSELQDRRKF